jgi:hypothetical protein
MLNGPEPIRVVSDNMALTNWHRADGQTAKPLVLTTLTTDFNDSAINLSIPETHSASMPQVGVIISVGKTVTTTLSPPNLSKGLESLANSFSLSTALEPARNQADQYTSSLVTHNNLDDIKTEPDLVIQPPPPKRPHVSCTTTSPPKDNSTTTRSHTH